MRISFGLSATTVTDLVPGCTTMVEGGPGETTMLTAPAYGTRPLGPTK
jgi:hypothetical protein